MAIENDNRTKNNGEQDTTPAKKIYFGSIDSFIEREFAKHGTDMSRDAKEYDIKHHVNDPKITEKAGQLYGPDEAYKTFCENLDADVAAAFGKVFARGTLHPEEVMGVIKDTVLSIDCRAYKTMFGDIEPLEARLRQYEARDGLSAEEEAHYLCLKAVFKLKEAFGNKDKKNKLLFDAYDALKAAGKNHLAENVAGIFEAVEEFYRS